jgi:hypothetical protein
MAGTNDQDAEVMVGIRMAGLRGENRAVEFLSIRQIARLMMNYCLM